MDSYKISNTKREDREAVLISANEFARLNRLCPVEVEDNAIISLNTATINRPGLLFAGLEKFFGHTRVQVVGTAEVSYLEQFDDETQHKKLESLFKKSVPAVIFARGIAPTDYIKSLAKKYKTPLFESSLVTGILVNTLFKNIESLIASEITIHGVLVEVFGVGVLIQGDSGIGKSETALELIHRGHCLVADDAVQIKRLRNELIGSAPELIRNLMELRGVGIIDVAKLFGVGSVIESTKIEYVIKLEMWNDEKDYIRASVAMDNYDIMGIDIPCSVIPIMPGRNLAIIIEVAARNFKVRKNEIEKINHTQSVDLSNLEDYASEISDE